RRSSRDVNSPAPVDCQLSQWSEWTDCFPCQEKKVRLRCNVSIYLQMYMGGKQHNQCQLTKMCTLGRCIKRHLVCNGEPDCRDGSDEENCDDEDIESPCEHLFPIPGSEKAAQGYNILTQEESQYVYDPHFFGGHCEYVYNGEWRELKYDAACEHLYYGDDEKFFRKPYNFHIYQFLAHADSGFTFEFYDDSKDLLDALQSDKSKTTGFTIGIKPKDLPFQLNLGFTLSGGKGSLKNFTQYTAKEVGFIRGVTKVQTARFKMRRDNIVLDEDVLLSLRELPDTYNYGMYAKFINDYGTHFVTSGTMGGIFEYILVVNKEEMRRKEITAEEISACVGRSIGLTVSESKLYLGASVSSSDCAKKGFLNTGMIAGQMSTNSAVVEDIIPRIRGGDTSYSGGLLNSWDGNMYRHWGRSLKYNPAVIDFEVRLFCTPQCLSYSDGRKIKPSIQSFPTQSTLLHSGHMQHFRLEYLFFSPFFLNAFAGAETNGRWSCWSQWGPCQAGIARRSRRCNNPAPQHGGEPCTGRDVQSRAC
ncbi:CO8A protein, partial [Columbina picui]|nr:CO8A protein [Columbina picui]